ncbi:MAG: sugar phosphate isomerase/epimerase [Clostridiaceae bacterium]|jgi:sugar phosphate isomerase/epimerase|nr:sugar phosphate isomerase/epimerase [Clostridiaceae bacterium]
MDTKKIVAQLYTLRDFCQTAEDLAETFKKVRSIGYEAVQVSAIGPIDPVKVKELADKEGLKIIVTHISYNRLKNDLDALIKEHKLWDCYYIGLGAMPAEFRTSKEGFIAFAKEFNEIGKRIKDNGLRFVYHNHKFEFEKFDGVTGMEILYNETNPEVFDFEIDTYWVQAGGGNPTDWIRKMKGRMDVVHLKDMAIVKDQQVFAEIGQGNLNWQSIIEACEEIGVKWYCVEQDVCMRDPFESMAMSYEYLKNL